MLRRHSAHLATSLLLLFVAVGAWATTKNGFEVDDGLIPVAEIRSGGPPRDGIPALTDPDMVEGASATFLEDGDRVLGVVLAGEARAYPVKILDWHEVVNDRIGNQYFAVTYCPLCGSGIVFGSNAGEGRLVFGVSGLLFDSDVLLYDRNTESLWSQLMGKAVTGKLKGTDLPQIPALHTTWGFWRQRHPESMVMSTSTGFARNYERSPYIDYPKSRRLYFEVSNKAPRRFHTKELVLGIKIDGFAKAYAFSTLTQHGAAQFKDTVGSTAVTIHWDAASESAYATDSRGELLPTTIAYWFAWYTFNPATTVFTPEKHSS